MEHLFAGCPADPVVTPNLQQLAHLRRLVPAHSMSSLKLFRNGIGPQFEVVRKIRGLQKDGIAFEREGKLVRTDECL